MFYAHIKNGKITGCGQAKNISENVTNVTVSETIFNALVDDLESYVYQEGSIIPNPNYEEVLQERNKASQILTIKKQLDDLDKKRIRAICEPSEKETGVTWIDFYNSQVLSLRQQLKSLETGDN